MIFVKALEKCREKIRWVANENGDKWRWELDFLEPCEKALEFAVKCNAHNIDEPPEHENWVLLKLEKRTEIARHSLEFDKWITNKMITVPEDELAGAEWWRELP